VGHDEIEHFVTQPPHDTRAWTRAMVLRRFDPNEIERVDWDHIRLRIQKDDGPREFELRLDDPLGFTREATASLFESDTTERRLQ
jgi:hypothetical protein